MSVPTLKEYLNYDSKTGNITWKKERVGRGRNAARVGKKVGHLTTRGYVQIIFNNKQYKAHRVAWFLYYGKWPKNQIDHINGNKSDNRIKNIRDVTNVENCRNKEKHRRGHLLGTTFCKKSKKWVAQITIKGRGINLGNFKTKLAAHKKYKQEADELPR